MLCQSEHRYWGFLEDLPKDQGVEKGRHRCCGCAYEKGHKAGEALQTNFEFNLDELPFSQAGTVRHRSVHAAFAQGYLDGVKSLYQIGVIKP